VLYVFGWFSTAHCQVTVLQLAVEVPDGKQCISFADIHQLEIVSAVS